MFSAFLLGKNQLFAQTAAATTMNATNIGYSSPTNAGADVEGTYTMSGVSGNILPRFYYGTDSAAVANSTAFSIANGVSTLAGATRPASTSGTETGRIAGLPGAGFYYLKFAVLYSGAGGASREAFGQVLQFFVPIYRQPTISIVPTLAVTPTITDGSVTTYGNISDNASNCRVSLTYTALAPQTHSRSIFLTTTTPSTSFVPITVNMTGMYRNTTYSCVLNYACTSGFVTVSEPVTVTTTNTGPACTFSATNTVVNGGCGSGSITTSAGDGYEWRMSGSTATLPGTQTISNLSSGTYSVIVTNNGCSATQSSVITSSTGSTPIITINANTLSTALGTGYTYIWYLNGSAISNATANTYSPTQNGNYTVQVTYSPGCAVTSAAFTYTTTVGLEETNATSKNITLFPNPAYNTLQINAVNTVLKEVQICSLEGKLLISHVSNLQSNNFIDISDLNAGLYFVRILDIENELSIHKIVKY